MNKKKKINKIHKMTFLFVLACFCFGCYSISVFLDYISSYNHGYLKKITKEVPYEEILKQDIDGIEIGLINFEDATLISNSSMIYTKKIVEGHYNGELVKGGLYKRNFFDSMSIDCNIRDGISLEKKDGFILLEMNERDILDFSPQSTFKCMAAMIVDLRTSYNRIKVQEERSLDEKIQQDKNKKEWRLYKNN